MGARFSAPIHSSLGTYPASCTMGTGSLSGVKRPGRGADHPPLSKCRGHERLGLYLYSPSGPQWPVIGRIFPFVTDTPTGMFLRKFSTRRVTCSAWTLKMTVILLSETSVSSYQSAWHYKPLHLNLHSSTHTISSPLSCTH